MVTEWFSILHPSFVFQNRIQGYIFDNSKVVAVVCLLTVSITNIASNTATANVLVPILGEMAVTMCVNPIYLTLPAGNLPFTIYLS